MLKQQTVPTSLGQLTVSSLTLGELRQLDSLFQDKSSAENSGLVSLLRYLPVVQNAVRKVHQDLTSEQLENGLPEIEGGQVPFERIFAVVRAAVELGQRQRQPAKKAFIRDESAGHERTQGGVMVRPTSCGQTPA